MCDNEKNNLFKIKNKSDIKENSHVEYNYAEDFFQIILTKDPVFYEAICHFIDIVRRSDDNEIVGVQINGLYYLLEVAQELYSGKLAEEEKQRFEEIIGKLKNL